MKINRPAEDGEPMTKVLLDGEGYDPAAMRRPPTPSASALPGEEEESEREKKAKLLPPPDWDDAGVFGERS